MSNAPKTVLCIHDLPGFGRAGLSVIVPVLSALGAQAVAVPTAVLSPHTGGLGTPAELSNPGYGPAALAHYQRLGLRFDCIYSGYLADPTQAKLVEQAFELWPRALKVVDPVLGDGGRLYKGLEFPANASQASSPKRRCRSWAAPPSAGCPLIPSWSKGADTAMVRLFSRAKT